MADVHTKEIRSKNMAAIKGKNTKPEMLVRRFLHFNGYRYTLHDKKLPANLILYYQNIGVSSRLPFFEMLSITLLHV